MTPTYPSRIWLALPLAAAALLFLSPTGPVRAAPPSAGDSSDLDPTASQRAKMAAGQARFQKDVAALRADSRLSEAQKRAKFLALTQAADKEMLAILSPAQRDLVLKQRAIDDGVRQQVMALRADPRMTNEQKQARFEALMRDRQAALLATLPPAQRARAERAHQAQMAARAARVAEVNRVGAQLEKSLSKKTLAQIRQISLAAHGQIQAVNADPSLSEAGKAARIQSLSRETETKIAALLTPQQRTQWTRYHELVDPSAP